MGYPNSWMVYRKNIYKWMIWGYPYFRKPPYIYILHKPEGRDPLFLSPWQGCEVSSFSPSSAPATSRPAPSATTFEPLASWLPMRGTKDPALSREEPQRMGDFTNKNCDLTRFNQEKC